jgi:hypothetical protein
VKGGIWLWSLVVLVETKDGFGLDLVGGKTDLMNLDSHNFFFFLFLFSYWFFAWCGFFIRVLHDLFFSFLEMLCVFLHLGYSSFDGLV